MGEERGVLWRRTLYDLREDGGSDLCSVGHGRGRAHGQEDSKGKGREVGPSRPMSQVPGA